MRRKKTRRQSQGSAWHWKQTNTWYYTHPESKKRVPLFDEDGNRIKGKENKKTAEIALTRIMHPGDGQATPLQVPESEWLVAKVCSEYIKNCEYRLSKGALSTTHRKSTVSFLNDLCKYCGALPVAQLKKGLVQNWLDSHSTWKSPATYRGAISIVLAAFNHAQAMYDVVNPIKGLKKPPPNPRLYSFNREDEEAIYRATDGPFGDFVFAAIHTGLRPYCELARITADMVVESERGMMWRVPASKTKKTRKIPVLPVVADLTRKLMESAPKGSGISLFLNPRGRPWKKCAGVFRFIQIRRALGWDEDPVKRHYTSYICRHTFAHRMLSGYWTGGVGCSIEVLAELIGDTPKVAFDHYGKEWGQHYQEPLWAAMGLAQPAAKQAQSRARRFRRRIEAQPA